MGYLVDMLSRQWLLEKDAHLERKCSRLQHGIANSTQFSFHYGCIRVIIVFIILNLVFISIYFKFVFSIFSFLLVFPVSLFISELPSLF